MMKCYFFEEKLYVELGNGLIWALSESEGCLEAKAVDSVPRKAKVLFSGEQACV